MFPRVAVMCHQLSYFYSDNNFNFSLMKCAGKKSRKCNEICTYKGKRPVICFFIKEGQIQPY